VSYLIAILALAAACILWFWVQRWAGAGEAGATGREPECEGCERAETQCPSAPTPHGQVPGQQRRA
jgi:hypothetical protein